MYNWDKYFKKKTAQENTRNAAAEFAESLSGRLSKTSTKNHVGNKPGVKHLQMQQKSELFYNELNENNSHTVSSAFSVIDSLDKSATKLEFPIRSQTGSQNSESSEIPHSINHILDSPKKDGCVLNNENVDFVSVRFENGSVINNETPKKVPLISISNPKLVVQNMDVESKTDDGLDKETIKENTPEQIYIGCEKCAKLQKEIDGVKKQSQQNFQIFKQKIMSTGELISEYHRKCQELGKQKQLLSELKSKLDGCYGETGALRIQLEKALQANDPLKKTVRRFEYEKILIQSEADELKKKLQKVEFDLTELKDVVGASQVRQDAFKKTKEDISKELQKEKKKVINQAKLLDKLTIKLKEERAKNKNSNKTFKESSKEYGKLKKNIEILKRENESLRKHSRSGKASRKSPRGVLSPSPSPPISPMILPVKENYRKKPTKIRKNDEMKDDLKAVSSESGGTSSSSDETEYDTCDELQEFLTRTLPPHVSPAKRFRIPTLLSPPLSPIPPSPLSWENSQEQEKNQVTLSTTDQSSSYLNEEGNNLSATANLFGDVSQSDDDSQTNKLITQTDVQMQKENVVNNNVKSQFEDGVSRNSKNNVDLKEFTVESNIQGEEVSNIVSSDQSADTQNVVQPQSVVLHKEQSRTIQKDINKRCDAEVSDVSTASSDSDTEECTEEKQLKSKQKVRNIKRSNISTRNAAIFSKRITRSSLLKSVSVSRHSRSESDHGKRGEAKLVKRSSSVCKTQRDTVKFKDELSSSDNVSTPPLDYLKQTLKRKSNQTVDNSCEKKTNFDNALENEKKSIDFEICKGIETSTEKVSTGILLSGNVEEPNITFDFCHRKDMSSSACGSAPSENNNNNDNIIICMQIKPDKQTEVMLEQQPELKLGQPSQATLSQLTEHKLDQLSNVTLEQPSKITHQPPEDTHPEVMIKFNQSFAKTLDQPLDGKLNQHSEAIDQSYKQSSDMNILDVKSDLHNIKTKDVAVRNIEEDVLLKPVESVNPNNAPEHNLTDNKIVGDARSTQLIQSNILTHSDAEREHCVNSPTDDASEHINKPESNTSIVLPNKSAGIVKQDTLSESNIQSDPENSFPEHIINTIKEKIPSDSIITTSTHKLSSNLEKQDRRSACVTQTSLYGGIDNIVKKPSDTQFSHRKIVASAEMEEAESASDTETGHREGVASAGTEETVFTSDSQTSSFKETSNKIVNITAESTNIMLDHIYKTESYDKTKQSDEPVKKNHTMSCSLRTSNIDDKMDSEVASFKLPNPQSAEQSVQGNKPFTKQSFHGSSNKRVSLKNSIDRTFGVTSATPMMHGVTTISTTHSIVTTKLQPVKAKPVITRRHSMFTSFSSANTVPMHVERTKSLSPSVFSPPSPPLSPIPPSPRRSILTPIISPLPTTPVPELVSPLPPSPKITSPPLIRGSALLYHENSSVFVPKPMSHVAAKQLHFNNDNHTKKRLYSNQKPSNAINTGGMVTSNNVNKNVNDSSTVDNRFPGNDNVDIKKNNKLIKKQLVMFSNRALQMADAFDSKSDEDVKDQSRFARTAHKSKQHNIAYSLPLKLNKNKRPQRIATSSSTISTPPKQQKFSTDNSLLVCNVKQTHVPLTKLPLESFISPSAISTIVSHQSHTSHIDTDAIKTCEKQSNINDKTSRTSGSNKTTFSASSDDDALCIAMEGSTSQEEDNNQGLDTSLNRITMPTDVVTKTQKERFTVESNSNVVACNILKTQNSLQRLNTPDLFNTQSLTITDSLNLSQSLVNLHSIDTIKMSKSPKTEKEQSQKEIEAQKLSASESIISNNTIHNNTPTLCSDNVIKMKKQQEGEDGEISDDDLAIDSNAAAIQEMMDVQQKGEDGELTDDSLAIDPTAAIQKNTYKTKVSESTESTTTNASCKKRDRHQTERGFALKLLKKIENKSMSKKNVILALSNRNNLTSAQEFAKAVINCLRTCEITLLPTILRTLNSSVEEGENTETCDCLLPPGTTCVNCSSSPCSCQDLLCTECNKQRTNVRTMDLDTMFKNNIFKMCHSLAEKMKVPVLTVFELDLLFIFQSLFRQRYLKFEMFLSMLRRSVCTEEDMLSCERLALCRFYAAACRLNNNLNELISFIFALAYDEIHISFSTIFITCYSIWPSIVARTDLIMASEDTNDLILYKIKLSPLSAVFQLIALCDAVRRKDSTSQKILEKIMNIEWKNEILTSLKVVTEELFHLLCNPELSFIETSNGDGVVLCPFVFSVIKSIELLCKKLGWEWTYNVLVVGKIHAVIKKWSEGLNDIHTDTVVVLIRLTGHLCQYGLLSGYNNFHELSQLLSSFLIKCSEEDLAYESVQVATAYTLLDIAPSEPSFCRHILQSWLLFTEKKNYVIPQLLKQNILEIIIT